MDKSGPDTSTKSSDWRGTGEWGTGWVISLMSDNPLGRRDLFIRQTTNHGPPSTREGRPSP